MHFFAVYTVIFSEITLISDRENEAHFLADEVSAGGAEDVKPKSQDGRW